MTCRSCDVCNGSSHHWMDHVPEWDEDSEPPEWQPGDPTHCCKHCPQLGVECPVCFGDGDDQHGNTCEKCSGEGVIPWRSPN